MHARPQNPVIELEQGDRVEVENADGRQHQAVQDLRDRAVPVQILDPLEDRAHAAEMVLEVGVDLAQAVSLAADFLFEDLGLEGQDLLIAVPVEDPLHLEEQLARGERLREVVVGAGAESLKAALGGWCCPRSE